MSDQLKFVCGSCKVAPEIVTDADGNAEAVCPRCGQRDKIEDVQRIGGEHFLQSSMPGFQKGIGKAFSGKFTKFEAEPIRKRAFKWHAEAIRV